MNPPLDLTVMMYHYVRDPGDAAEAGSGIAGLPTQAFESQLDDIGRQHTFVTWRDVHQALQGGQPLPASACLLTFDDGVRDHYLHVFRILRERNLSGLFFVLDRLGQNRLVLAHRIHFLLAKLGVQGLRDAIWDRLDSMQRKPFVQAENRYRLKYPGRSIDSEINVLKAVLQREFSAQVDPLLGDLFARHIGSEAEIAQEYYLNPEQIREMRLAGMYFGGHSRNHPWFDWIDAARRAAEIQASAAWLRQFEPEPWAFAYPYGGLSPDSPELLMKHGFVAAFTTREQVQHTDPYLIGRLDGEDFVPNGYPHA